MVEDRVDDLMIENERDDPHLRLTPRANQRVRLVDPLDELSPPAAQEAGAGAGLLANVHCQGAGG